MGLTQRQQQAVNANIVLDQFDTGKVLIVSSSAVVSPAAGILCSLPSASAVNAGFFCTVLLASEHSHSVRRVGGVTDTVVGKADTATPLVPAVNSGVTALSLSSNSATAVGERLEIFCDGTLWYIYANSFGCWTALL